MVLSEAFSHMGILIVPLPLGKMRTQRRASAGTYCVCLCVCIQVTLNQSAIFCGRLILQNLLRLANTWIHTRIARIMRWAYLVFTVGASCALYILNFPARWEWACGTSPKKKKISGLEPGGRRGPSVCFRAAHFFPCVFPMFFLLFPSFVHMCSYFCVCFPIFLKYVCDFRFKLPLPPKKKTFPDLPSHPDPRRPPLNPPGTPKPSLAPLNPSRFLRILLFILVLLCPGPIAFSDKPRSQRWSKNVITYDIPFWWCCTWHPCSRSTLIFLRVSFWSCFFLSVAMIRKESECWVEV